MIRPEEVLQMTENLLDLEKALHLYFDEEVMIHFEKNKLFMYDAITQTYSQEDFPLQVISISLLEIDNPDLIQELKAQEKNNGIIEIDAIMMARDIDDDNWNRPINVNLCVIADKRSKMIMNATPIEPLTSPLVVFANNVIESIFRYGRFKEIHISSPYYKGALKHICEICDIKLVVSKKLPAIDSFVKEMSNPYKRFH